MQMEKVSYRRNHQAFWSLLFSLFTLVSAPELASQTPAGADTLKKASAVIADKAVLELISNQFSFTEGPAADKSGNVYFTDQPNNKIWKYSTTGETSIFKHNAGRSNGMYFDAKGNLLTCADEHNQLWSITPDTQVTILLKEVNEKQLNGPNDLWISPAGSIYFTDPYYQRPYWTRQKPALQSQDVYYLGKNEKPIVVASGLLQPNGIIGTADGKYLYVADIKANKTFRYNILPNGTLSTPTLFVSQGSDGMTIDDAGNIYLTGKGVTVYNSKGQWIEHIEVPEPWTANVTFGGKEKDLLFITASKSVYLLKMKVKGVN
jgi:gluconolactonase